MRHSLILFALLVIPSGASTGPLQVLSSGPDGLTLELELPPPRLVPISFAGQSFDDLVAPGCARFDQPGQPALPFFAELLAVPPGARIHLEVRPLHYLDMEDISFVPAPTFHADNPDQPAYEPDPAYYHQDALAPGVQAEVEHLGTLRGVSAHALRVYPFSYNPARRTLRVYDRLEIRVHFKGGRRSKPLSRGPAPGDSGLYKAFLNASQAPDFSVSRAAKPTVQEWYDAGAPWIKIYVFQDGLYRLDPAWLEKRDIDPLDLDPRTFRLLYEGREQAIYVHGSADGQFDPGDYLDFHGRFRRDNKNFDSPYGRRNTYWLTWGNEPGKRLVERSGAPLNDYPVSRSYWKTAHFERDIIYDPLPSAPNNERDHWFWDRPITATKPDVPSSRSLAGELDQLDTRTGYTARIRVALHGATGAGHHIVIQLNQRSLNDRIIDERIWEGQTELLIEQDIPASYLNRGTNRLLLKAFADQAKWDQVYLNWFEIDYLQSFRTRTGYLDFEHPPSSGHRISIRDFSTPDIQVYDVANGVRLVDVEIDSLGAVFGVTFEDVAEEPALYVVADSLGLKTPIGLQDQASSLHNPAHAADYLIITHSRFLLSAQTLADHRRASGLEVEVVDVEDIYDEFSHGLVTREAVRDFIHYAYHHWQGRPAYILLMGDVTYDYRNIEGFGKQSFVPTLYYQARDRGNTPSDFHYTLVDGDDLLPDLAIGRLAVENFREAEKVVEKIIRYDQEPEPGDWRSRVIYLANQHESNFIQPSNALASRFTEPLGLESVKIFNPDNTPIPNLTGREFVETFNAGALLLNFNGHGSVGSMAFLVSIDMPDWDYLSQVDNSQRLPLVLAFSCLNGLYNNPRLESLGEAFTTREEGGSIAYISASAKSFVAQNNLLGEHLFNQFFNEGNLEFGPTLNAAKVQVLAAHSSWVTAARTMQLLGDPAQKLALPQGADYAPVSLDIAPREVFGHSTLKIEATLRNNARSTADSLEVAVLGYRTAETRPETLLYASQAPFAGIQTLSFDWPVQDRRGPYRLELWLDPEDRVVELDEHNNRLQLDLDILEPLIPTLLFPGSNAVESPRGLSLEAVLPLSAPASTCEFALSTDPAFAPENAVASGLVLPEEGLAIFRTELADEERGYFWKVRLLTSTSAGPWSPPRSFHTSTLQAPPAWSQQSAQLLAGQVQDLVLDAAERLSFSPASLPFRPADDTREDGFTVRGLNGAGVLCTDGTYVYAKRWYNGDSTIYPGTDFFTRVGTGYNNTRRDLKYGVLADSTTAGIAATYHSDGYIYNDSGKAFELERIGVETGELDTVEVAEGLLEWQSGHIVDGRSLFTSDGRYIYNVAMSSEAGMRNEWRVRVFDPASSWSLVREFTSPPTENGFTFMWTDGVLADGERLYFIEHAGQRRIRMVDAVDGSFLDEWESDQDITRIITGQYDWVNNKVWLGDLFGSAIFRYPGLGRIEAGQLTSQPIGPAASWRSLSIAGNASGDARLSVDVMVQDPAADTWTLLPGFADLEAEKEVDLSGIDAVEHRRIRLRARLNGSPETVHLQSWTMEFEPLPELRVEQAEAGLDSAGLLQVRVRVRNLSAQEAIDLSLRLERGDQTQPLLERPLAPLERGETRLIVLDSLALPPLGSRLFARVLAAQPDADPADNRLEIPLLFAGRAPLLFRIWPEEKPFLDGDPLRPDQGLIVQAPGIADGRILLTVDGVPATPDSILTAATADDGSRVLYLPDLAPGIHTLRVRLFKGQEEVGSREIRFSISAELSIANPLIYPHPVQEEAAFTYVLSHDAEVSVEIYSLSGRLVRCLGPQAQPAGFQQLAWDGRDQGGQRLANGTYLYRILAAGSEKEAEFHGPLSVMR